MKKTLLTLSFVVISMVAFGQAKIELGLKGGANFANANIQNVNSDGVTSWHGGAFFLVKLVNIGIQPEVLYSSQGANVTGTGDVDFNYINIPVMLKFYLPAGINLQAGPQFGMLTDNLKDLNGDGTKEQLKSSDLSAAFGAGIDLPFGLKVDARYVIGLSDINDDALITNEVKNKMFQLSLGYSLFKLGK